MDGNEKDELHRSIFMLQHGILGCIAIAFGILIFACIRDISRGVQNIRDTLVILQDMTERNPRLTNRFIKDFDWHDEENGVPEL